MKGKVKFYNEKKGFGFIVREDKKGDIFFHISDVEEDKLLEQTDEVSFEVAEGIKGKKKAVKVKRIVE